MKLDYKISSSFLLDDPVEMKKAYSSTVFEMAKENKNIVALDADLVSCIGMQEFQKTFPDRMINCGIQEANMMGVAAGLSIVGKIPYVHTFGPFASRRCFDQVFLSIGYAKANVKIIGSDPGVTAMYNGGTHMPFEDVALMKVIPNMTILEPSDNSLLVSILKQIAGIYGNYYIRIPRRAPTYIYEKGSEFEIGKSIELREGRDATIVASGSIMVPNALKAADILSRDGISVRVIDMFTIKPIDKDAILKAANETGAIITAENHNLINGLASSVADILVANYPVPMGKVGVMDRFGQVGSLNYLIKEYNLTEHDIVETVKQTIGRKVKKVK